MIPQVDVFTGPIGTAGILAQLRGDFSLRPFWSSVISCWKNAMRRLQLGRMGLDHEGRRMADHLTCFEMLPCLACSSVRSKPAQSIWSIIPCRSNPGLRCIQELDFSVCLILQEPVHPIQCSGGSSSLLASHHVQGCSN